MVLGPESDRKLCVERWVIARRKQNSDSLALGEAAASLERETDDRPHYSPSVKDLPATDRPRERLAHHGADKLSTQEQFRVLLLDMKNHVLRNHMLYSGSLNSSPIRIAEVFKPAVLENAAAIIAVHNHPSGDPTPSEDDIRTTDEIRRAGELLDIQLLDHIIIGRHGHVILKDRRLGFP